MTDLFITHFDWTGAAKGPTRDRMFSRDCDVWFDGHRLPLSAAPEFRGDPARVNPEQLFVAALSACQALTYLALAARAGIAIVNYRDDAEGRLGLVDGKRRMSHVTLRPRITLDAEVDEAKARELVDAAHHNCFIANSVSTPVEIEPAFDIAAIPVA
jgi:organic hydroperoxide reductase OsmC/OhrA